MREALFYPKQTVEIIGPEHLPSDKEHPWGRDGSLEYVGRITNVVDTDDVFVIVKLDGKEHVFHEDDVAAFKYPLDDPL